MIAVTVSGCCLDHRNRTVDQQRVLDAVASEPDPEDDLEPDPGGEFRHRVQSILDRIGANTFGYLGKVGEILRDLLRRDDGGRIPGGLILPERRIRDAIEFCRGIDRRQRQHHRRRQPPPDRGGQAQRYQQESERRAKADRPAPKSGEYISLFSGVRQPCRPADAACCTIAPRHGSGDIRPASNKKHQERALFCSKLITALRVK